jgi:hypothetical protein
MWFVSKIGPLIEIKALHFRHIMVEIWENDIAYYLVRHARSAVIFDGYALFIILKRFNE